MMLNAEQEKAAYYSGKKPLLIEAGPGAGKTRVIIERVKFLYFKLKVDPASIVVITFSRKAAEELIFRLAKEDIPPEDIALMNISTIHSFCFSLLSFDHSVLEIISDDNDERLNLFIRKHLKELGFKDTATLQSKREVESVISKFNEFTSFDVDCENLVTYIEENNPVCEEFISLVEESEEFPREEVKNNYKDDWYNARYLQIAKAYPIFLELLEKAGYIDFASIQRRAFEYLEDNPETPYKHILVDEFQDTDVVQFNIFQKLIDQCETFTAVGDVDQCIYGFRGATEDYFEIMEDTYDCEVVNLNLNYRSSDEVIDLAEKYIKYQRRESSEKGGIGTRKISKPSFYINSDKNQDEAVKIADIIRHLKDSGKVKNYSDIAILTRSINNNTANITTALHNNYVPYHITGLDDFIDSKEIKSVIATLYAIIPPSDKPHVMSKWEKDWLNLKAFTSEDFEYMIHNFSEESKEIFRDLQDNFESDVVSFEKEIYEEFTGKKSRIKKFQGVFNRDEEILVEIFRNVQKPDLLKVKLNNKEDQEFLDFLKFFREKFFGEDSSKSLDTLSLFYYILHRGGFLEYDYLMDPINRNILNDLSQLSQTIYNYGKMMSKKDLRGLYWFLTSKLDSYSKNIDPDEDAVAIMTVHKSKGLEFPVVIIPSIAEKKFPTSYKDQEKNRYIAGNPTFYTPDKYLKLKRKRNSEEKEKIHIEEEDRIMYVAMTRAKDTLILSTIEKIPEKLRNLIDNSENISYLENYRQLEHVESEEKEEKIKMHRLDYTKLSDYQECPFRFYLLHELNFKFHENKDMKKGIKVHKIFQNINQELSKEGEITEEKMNEIIDNVLSKDSEELKEEIRQDIKSYYDNFGKDIKVIASELPFMIKTENLTLGGIIDLIFEKDGKLGILDYKNTKIEGNYIDAYNQQLHIYMYALSLHPRFKDQKVEILQAYAVKSKEMIDIEIDEELMNDIPNILEKMANNILLDNFGKTSNKEVCEGCVIEPICKEDEG